MCVHSLFSPHSAHVTFNEADFPFRAQYQADPRPFNLFEEQAGQEFRHLASGESWGTSLTPGCAQGKGNDGENSSAGAHNALGFGGSRRVWGQGPSAVVTSLEPLARGGLGVDRGPHRGSNQGNDLGINRKFPNRIWITRWMVVWRPRAGRWLILLGLNQAFQHPRLRSGLTVDHLMSQVPKGRVNLT